MKEHNDILERLAAPFDPRVISWRVGSTTADKTRGMALAYIDARDVMDRLDEVMGPHWQCRYIAMPDKSMCCELGLLIEGDWIWRADGAGETDFEGTKGAFSDALKRAAVRFGVGRYLYGLAAPWVAVEARGRNLVIAKHELAQLQELLPHPNGLKGDLQQSVAQEEQQQGDELERLIDNGAVSRGMPEKKPTTPPDYERVTRLLENCKTMRALANIWKHEQAAIKAWPDDWVDKVTKLKDACKAELSEAKAA